MAIYSVQVKSLSRGKGDSATAAAAYRAGLDLVDPSGTRHTYSRKTGVLSVDMLAPADAPAWALDPHQVWANVEERETRKNARVAREVLIALPHELDPGQRRQLAKDVGQLLVERYGVAAQVALHAPDKGGDGRNYHAHILMTPRVVGADGFGDSAARVLDEYKAGAEEVKVLRSAIGARINLALSAAGVAARVDHRSLIDQKAEAAREQDFARVVELDRPATKHEGKAVTRARRRGERLPRARRNDRVRDAAASRADAHAERFEALKAQAAAQGRLAPVDEQALHAQALLERGKESVQRLRSAVNNLTNEAPCHDPISHTRQPGCQRPRRTPALTRSSVDACRVRNPGAGGQRVPALQPLHSANPCLAPRGERTSEAGGFSRVLRRDEQRRDSPRSSLLNLRIPTVGAQTGAAVQARAQQAAHKAGSSMPRPAAGAAGHQVTGAAAIERASRKHSQSRQGETMAVEQTAKNLEEMIEQMFKVARKSIQASDTTPLQRSAARTLLERRTELDERRAAYTAAKDDREQARLARRMAVGHANMTPVPTDLRSRTLRTVGRPTVADRAAEAAKEQKGEAMAQEQQARRLRDTTRLARNQAVVAFELAKADFLVQFPRQFPPAKPTAELAPTRDMAPVPPPPEQAVPPPEPVSPPRRPPPPRL